MDQAARDAPLRGVGRPNAVNDSLADNFTGIVNFHHLGRDGKDLAARGNQTVELNLQCRGVMYEAHANFADRHDFAIHFEPRGKDGSEPHSGDWMSIARTDVPRLEL